MTRPFDASDFRACWKLSAPQINQIRDPLPPALTTWKSQPIIDREKNNLVVEEVWVDVYRIFETLGILYVNDNSLYNSWLGLEGSKEVTQRLKGSYSQ